VYSVASLCSTRRRALCGKKSLKYRERIQKLRLRSRYHCLTAIMHHAVVTARTSHQCSCCTRRLIECRWLSLMVGDLHSTSSRVCPRGHGQRCQKRFCKSLNDNPLSTLNSDRGYFRSWIRCWMKCWRTHSSGVSTIYFFRITSKMKTFPPSFYLWVIGRKVEGIHAQKLTQ